MKAALMSLTAVAVLALGVPAIGASEEPVPTTSREHAPNTDTCPNQLVPPPARATSETPTPLPVSVAGNCGVTAPAGFEVPEEVLASAWLIADMDTGEIIAAKDPHGRYRPASIIKVLLALLAIDRLDPNQEVTVSEESAGQIGSAVGIGAGGHYTVDQLLHGLLLVSGNDAAHALAQELGGDDQVLADINELARELGTTDTVAASYSGLDAPGLATSAYDMGLIYREAYSRPEFRRIIDTDHVPFPGYDDRPGYEVWNDNGLFLNDPDGIGGKTGYTDDANHTFVGAMDRNDRRLFAVILDTTTDRARPWEQARLLLNAAYEIPDGDGVGLLEPVATEGSSATPTPAANLPGDAVKEPGVHAQEPAQPQNVIPGIIAVLTVSVLVALAVAITRRNR
ncbi:D-alanyl-D-alanine carboxypeptidase DacB precursor [Corynebacterium atrinae]|uniref:D-alanyl-D-alanine carboxypeptidase family protein n=1 Tax=Corynebacterium atrinae TaxID=1336740 RepID=UPI0025B3CCB6|nr:D-alanyl-D-alanine carboxypeptidase family protein [Corynebacterium atrinae]WJY62628.1 D-alanyl-D-alanine carboxypeptidase DacB precursor [Corynebacterium atrinae]